MKKLSLICLVGFFMVGCSGTKNDKTKEFTTKESKLEVSSMSTTTSETAESSTVTEKNEATTYSQEGISLFHSLCFTTIPAYFRRSCFCTTVYQVIKQSLRIEQLDESAVIALLAMNADSSNCRDSDCFMPFVRF